MSSAKKILFIHQNFPGQFVHVAAELARQGHEVLALGLKCRAVPGVRVVSYAVETLNRPSEIEVARDFETKAARGMACARAMDRLRLDGFTPDVIVAHPGWGEALFCKDVWPRARLVIFAEFFYHAEGADFNFDPEFPREGVALRARLRLKNNVHLQAFQAADAIYTPTHWQHSQLPAEYRPKAQIIFDGIDTEVVAPKADASIVLKRDGVTLKSGDEVLTFVNRNLEPYRGFHILMRALPEILRQRPQAHVVIVGRDEVSYGTRPANGGNWRQVMLAEVGAQLPMERVHFVGVLAYEVYLRVLQISRCHVYLTYPFVLSWSCLEAMSAGCVVVASDTGPVREVIEPDVNGRLFDFFDGAALATQVIQVLAGPTRFAALGRQARQSVIARYDLRSLCLPMQLAWVLGDVGAQPSLAVTKRATP